MKKRPKQFKEKYYNYVNKLKRIKKRQKKWAKKPHKMQIFYNYYNRGFGVVKVFNAKSISICFKVYSELPF